MKLNTGKGFKYQGCFWRNENNRRMFLVHPHYLIVLPQQLSKKDKQDFSSSENSSV